MRGFTPAQAAVLRDLRTIWQEDELVVIGATAIGCHLDFRWRRTADLDLTVATGIEVARKALQSVPGWTPHPRVLHEWIAPADVKVDVVPASRAALELGRIEWPNGSAMSALGLRAAFADAIRFDVGADLYVRVASLAALTILKMAASLDRPDRDRDLGDLAYLLEEAIGVDDDERWSGPALEADLDFELTGPYLLGRRVGVLADAREREVVEGFLKRLLNPDDRTATLSRMRRLGPMSWRDEPEARRRIEAFQSGLQGPPAWRLP